MWRFPFGNCLFGHCVYDPCASSIFSGRKGKPVYTSALSGLFTLLPKECFACRGILMWTPCYTLNDHVSLQQNNDLQQVLRIVSHLCLTQSQPVRSSRSGTEKEGEKSWSFMLHMSHRRFFSETRIIECSKNGIWYSSKSNYRISLGDILGRLILS